MCAIEMTFYYFPIFVMSMRRHCVCGSLDGLFDTKRAVEGRSTLRLHDGAQKRCKRLRILSSN